jgi:hypothetical protein
VPGKKNSVAWPGKFGNSATVEEKPMGFWELVMTLGNGSIRIHISSYFMIQLQLGDFIFDEFLFLNS